MFLNTFLLCERFVVAARISPRPLLPFGFQSSTGTEIFMERRIDLLLKMYSISIG